MADEHRHRSRCLARVEYDGRRLETQDKSIEGAADRQGRPRRRGTLSITDHIKFSGKFRRG